MTEKEKKALEKLVIEELRNQRLEENGGEFRGEIYADYRDEISGQVAGEIIDSDAPCRRSMKRCGSGTRVSNGTTSMS